MRTKQLLTADAKKIIKVALVLGLSVLVLIAGMRLLQVDIGDSWQNYLLKIIAGEQSVDTAKIPSLVIGTGLIAMTLGLVLQSRVAWAMSIFLLFMTSISVLFTHSHSNWYLFSCILLALILLFSYRLFDKSSLVASSIFASTSIFMVLAYATFGNYYLGSQFNPPITDLVTSLYYSMVTMSTVGYGDFSPKTAEAKLFTVSVIIAGLTVFVTSITSLVTPLLNSGLSKAIEEKGNKMKRKNHFVVIGNSSLAYNTCLQLARRGVHLTRILPPKFEYENIRTGNFDLIYGQSDRKDVLLEAGVDKASAVLSMLRDDADNAFSILAVKEINPTVKTIVAVNDSENTSKVSLAHPDIIISPQVFGGELTAKLLCEEEIDANFVMDSLFVKRKAKHSTDES